MKRLFSILLAGLITHLAPVETKAADAPPAGVEITTEEARTMRSCEVSEIEKNHEAYVGKIVKLKFGSRGSVFNKEADGAFSGTVCNKELRNFATVDVRVSQQGADWFSKVTADYASRKTYIAFARIKKSESGRVFAELIGRELKNDMKKTVITW